MIELRWYARKYKGRRSTNPGACGAPMMNCTITDVPILQYRNLPTRTGQKPSEWKDVPTFIKDETR